MRRSAAAILAAFALAGAETPAFAQGGVPKVVYGSDDRIDWYQADGNARLAADSTAVQMFSTQLTATDGGETYVLADDSRFGDFTYPTSAGTFPLCPEEPFYDQPAPGYCSAFVVGPDLMATAGHCVNAGNCAVYKFVFGFRMEDGATPVTSFPKDDVYSCAQVVGRAYTVSNTDWTVFRTDRGIAGHEPLPIRSAALGTVPASEDLTVIGHPSGLPVKIAGGATVQENLQSAYFTANLDTYGGNSGSAVFNAASVAAGLPIVEGILVRGATDFAKAQGRSCALSNVCPDEVGDCNGENSGEDCTRATEIEASIPAPSARGLLSLLFFLGPLPASYDKSGDASVDAGDAVRTLLSQAGL